MLKYSSQKNTIKTRPAHEKPEKEDGARILIDRIWPRGLKKDQAKLDLWLKDIAPSFRLRKWFSHDPKKWILFKKKYFQELSLKNREIEEILKKERKEKAITLVYGASEKRFNQAAALKEFIEERKSQSD